MPPEIHPTANVYQSQIGEGSKVAAFVEIGGATVGRNCKIQAFSFLCPGVHLEDEVFIGPHVCFTNDRVPRSKGDWNLCQTRVERGAAIGAGVVVLPGVTIGAGSMIAAGSLVETSVPAGYLLEERCGRSRLKRWFDRQEDIGLPMTFDQWRKRYDEMSYSEHVTFYDAVFEHFPEQQHGDLAAIRDFFSQLSGETAVLEIGGWDGAIAGAMLTEFPEIVRWHNFELCRKAVRRGLRNSRYQADVLPDFVWNVPELPVCEVFFAAHTIEHMRAQNLQSLFSRLKSVRSMYLEAPLPDSATAYCWNGRWNTHILEVGWKQVEQMTSDLGFTVTCRRPNIRMLER